MKPATSHLSINNWYIASCASLVSKYILSISGWWLIALSNGFVFPDPESPIINILYGWSVICGQFGLCYFIFSLVISSRIISFVFLNYIVTFNFFFFTYWSLFVPYAHVSIQSIDWVLLSSITPNEILLTSLVKTLCFSLLNLWF